MKTLKKVLAVALSVAMALSLVTIASAATTAPKKYQDYSDASSIQNIEAVDTLTAVGVLNGMGDGTYGPAGNFTREQAAKIVTCLLLGSTSAGSLKSTKAPFSDVAADRWSAPYIQFCVAKGIINGMGDGTFAPTASVTGAQFAKMLLTALGYGKLGEYTGSDWAINAIVDAQNLKILTTGKDYMAASTRDDVALYAFNAYTGAKCYVVALSKDLSSYVTTAPSNASYTDNLAYRQGVNPVAAGSPNGIKSHEWYQSGVVLNGNAYPDSSVTILGTDIKGTALSKLTDSTNSAYIATLDTNVSYYYNGTYVTASSVIPALTQQNKTSLAVLQSKLDTDLTSMGLGHVGEGGMSVQLVDTDGNGKADMIVVIEKTVVQLGGDAVVDSNGNVTVPGVCVAQPKANVIGYTGLKQNDIVLYYLDATGVYHIQKAKAVTGQLTGGNSMDIIFGGGFYFQSGLPGTLTYGSYNTLSQITSTTNLYSASATIYLDDAGNVVHFTTAAATTLTYGIVLGYSYNSIGGTAAVKLAKADGTVSSYSVATDATGTVPDQTSKFIGATNANTLVNGSTTTYTYPTGYLASYVIGSDGTIALTPVTTTATLGSAYTTKTATVSMNSATYYISSNTTVFYYDATKAYSSTNAVTATTGYSSTATVNNGTIGYDIAAGATNVLSVVLFNQAGTGVNQSAKYCYIASPYSSGASSSVVNGKIIFTYYVYIDGVSTALKSGDGHMFQVLKSINGNPYYESDIGLWNYTVDANGYITSTTQTTDSRVSASIGGVVLDTLYHTSQLSTVGSDVVAVDSGYVALANGNTYLTTSSTKFYQVVQSATAASVTAMSAIQKTSGVVHYKVIDVLKNSSDPTTADAIYYTYTISAS